MEKQKFKEGYYYDSVSKCHKCGNTERNAYFKGKGGYFVCSVCNIPIEKKSK